MKYVCIRHKYCKHREECGGAKPHEFDENECGKCPMDKSAKCMEENMLAMMMSEDDSFSRFLYKETIKDLGADIDTKKCFKEYYSEFKDVDVDNITTKTLYNILLKRATNIAIKEYKTNGEISASAISKATDYLGNVLSHLKIIYPELDKDITKVCETQLIVSLGFSTFSKKDDGEITIVSFT